MENFYSQNVKFLFPGDIYFGKSKNQIRTILGSCISVIMYDKKRKIGGITHSLLPDCMKNICTKDNCVDYSRSTVCSIEKLLHFFGNDNIEKSQIEFFIFGGSELIYSADSKINIGRKNIEAAFSVITQKGFKFQKEDVGGNFFRELTFFPSSGKILLKKTKYSFYNA